MRLIETKNNIDSIWELENKIIAVSGSILENEQGKVLNLEESINFYYSYKFIYNVKKDEIVLFDEFFKIKKRVFIENPVNISFYNNLDNYLVRHGSNENKYALFLQNKLVKEEENIIGVFLNYRYRLHFKARFKPITTFRCSELLDSQTYWEYECEEGYKAGRFYVWDNMLVFVKGNHENASLVLMELLTGRVVWENHIMYGEFTLDEKQGLLVSVWANKYVCNNYQLINLTERKVETGQFQSPMMLENVAVNWQMQYLHQTKLYFVDNVHSTYGEEARPIRFGCFDIVRKQLDFLQEVPEAAGGQFGQVLYCNNRLYLRSAANELFIFEDSSVS